MLPELNGKGLFVYSDPGGAKPILSYVSMYKHLTDFKIISDRVYDFENDFNIPVENHIQGNESKVIETFNPDFLFTGTSYTSKIELTYIHEAKMKGIQTYSFIDHYTGFIERFQKEKQFIIPDHICVLDKKAFYIAKSCGIMFNDVIITGNPYHSFLDEWKPHVTKNEFFAQLGIPIKNKLILFAPDPLTNVGGISVFGIDEQRILEHLANSLTEVKSKNYNILIKLHPNQKQENILSYIKTLDTTYFSVANKDIHTNTLLYYSDVVVGIYSNILVEAKLLNRKVIRHLQGLVTEDPLAENKVGVVTKTEQELGNVLNTFL